MKDQYLVGYTYDAAAYHPECFPVGIDPDGEEVGAIFEWDDNACDTTCDVCLEPLLECDCFDDE